MVNTGGKTGAHLLDRHADCCQCAAFLPGIQLSHVLGSSACPGLQCLRLLHTHYSLYVPCPSAVADHTSALPSLVADRGFALPLLVADRGFALPSLVADHVFALPSVVADLTFALFSPHWQPRPAPCLLRQAVALTVKQLQLLG